MGAVIFFGYIVAALAVTLLILNDLRAYHATRQRRINKDDGSSKKPSWQLRINIFMALISFTSLSFHMFAFLLTSYSSWSRQHAIPGQDQQRSQLRLWHWASTSSLFEDFARGLCVTPSAYFWTQKALLYSFLWNCHMARHSTKDFLQASLFVTE